MFFVQQPLKYCIYKTYSPERKRERKKRKKEREREREREREGGGEATPHRDDHFT